MKKVLSLYITVNNEYPEPSDAEEVTYSGSEVWSQGTFGDSVRSKLGSKANISETPYDPLTYNEYSYSVLNTKREYQIAVVYEGDLTSNLNTTNKTYAAGAYGTTKLAGDYNGKILKLGNCNSLTVLAVPSIIKANTGATDLETIIEGKQLVYDESKLLPSSYSGTTNFKQKLPTEEIVNTSYIKVFTGTCDELTTEANQQTFIDNLQQAYSGTVVSTTENIKPIINNPTLYTAQTIIHNSVDTEVKVTASNTSSSSGDSGFTHYNCEQDLTAADVDCLNGLYVDGNADQCGDAGGGGGGKGGGKAFIFPSFINTANAGKGGGKGGGGNTAKTKQDWCDFDGTLDFEKVGLDEIPDAIYKLTNITGLIVGELTNSIESEIGNLSNLNHLFLSGDFSNLPNSIKDLNNLTYLRFVNNNLGELSHSFSEKSEEKCQNNITENGKRICIKGNGNTINIKVLDSLLQCAEQPNYEHANFVNGVPTIDGTLWQNTDSEVACYYECTDGYTGDECGNAPPSCAEQPNYEHANFVDGNPTEVGISWQNTDSEAACYYSCEEGYIGEECDISCLTTAPSVTISQDPNCISNFTLVCDNSDNLLPYYLQSCTGLKWQYGNGSGKEWAAGCDDSNNKGCDQYGEPVWDGLSYTYNPPSGGNEEDYESFKYCESLGSGWRLPTKREGFSITKEIGGDSNLPNFNSGIQTSNEVASYKYSAWCILGKEPRYPDGKNNIGICDTICIYGSGSLVNWIGQTDQSNRFTDYSTNTSNYGTGYYLDTYIGLKWQAHDTTMTGNSDEAKNSRKWAIDNNYTEPTWDSDNGVYNYPSGRIATDYPAFKHCEDIGNGWRLPTRREIFSIMTDKDTEKNTNGKYTKLQSIKQSKYWSSTTITTNSDYAYNGYFNDSRITSGNKDNTYEYTICVHD